MFKALVAASIAMLVCCAAAAMAGPVHPSVDSGRFAEDADLESQRRSLSRESILRLVVESPHDLPPVRLDTVAPVDGFVPTVSLSSLHNGTIDKAPPEEIAAIQPVIQPAVIPLPIPLYAAAALLALTLLARRAILRAC